MKDYLIAFSMTQSMFLALPFPCRAWKEEARSKMLLFLPVIGAEIGLLWVLLHGLLRYVAIPGPVYGLAMCVLPYLLTGFIHLDGFMDVADAIGSWRELEKRRAILKDSHVGSVAVISCVFLIVAGTMLFSVVPAEAEGGCLFLLPVISRCCSAAAVLGLKPMKTSQYAANTASSTKRYVIWLMLLCICCVAAGFLFFGKYGFACVAALLGYALALRRSYRLLEGMNGDISGFCLTISELCGAAVFALI